MNTIDVFRVALKLAPYFLGQRPPQAQQSRTLLTDKDVALLNLKKKAGSVIVLLGSRDTGKTQLAYRLAEFLERPTYAVSPQQKPPDWITWVKLNEIEEKVKSRSTLIMDDLPAYMSNRDYSEQMVQVIEKMIPMVRHEAIPPEFPIGEIHLIFSSQSSAQADRYILDCDAAFLKPLGLLMGDIERPNIAKIYRMVVNEEFEGKDDAWIQKHAYMLSRGFKGLIEVSKTT